jgi:hypothetical protein
MDRKVGGALAGALFLTGLAAVVLWFVLFALQGALSAGGV